MLSSFVAYKVTFIKSKSTVKALHLEISSTSTCIVFIKYSSFLLSEGYPSNNTAAALFLIRSGMWRRITKYSLRSETRSCNSYKSLKYPMQCHILKLDNGVSRSLNRIEHRIAMITSGWTYNISGASDNALMESTSYFSQKACQLISVVVTST